MSDASPTALRLSTEGDTLIVVVESDQLTALRAVDRFETELKGLLDTRREKRWVVDFRGVTFMVTPAINAILHVLKRLKAAQGALAVTGLNRDIRHIFELMRLTEVIPVAQDLPAALQLVARRNA